MKKANKFLIALLILGVMLIVINPFKQKEPNGPCDKEINSEMEKTFNELFTDGFNFNNLVEMKYQSNDIPWTFLILNHSEETIIFPNNIFGLVGFHPKIDNKEWVPIELPIITSSPKDFSLPPNLKEYNPSVGHQLPILEKPFAKLGYERLRFFISGVGLQSGMRYGATFDICFESTK
jgi:hypothetical protein